MPLFKILGVLVGLYTAWSALTGSVHAKAGAGMRVVSRQDSPRYFWTVIAIYAGLGLALVFVF